MKRGKISLGDRDFVTRLTSDLDAELQDLFELLPSIFGSPGGVQYPGKAALGGQSSLVSITECLGSYLQRRASQRFG